MSDGGRGFGQRSKESRAGLTLTNTSHGLALTFVGDPRQLPWSWCDKSHFTARS